MARKPEGRPISPLRMVDALNGINGAASLFSATVETAAHLLQQPDITAKQANALGAKLAKEAEKFRSIVWPNDL